jgi:hypothetical protein
MCGRFTPLLIPACRSIYTLLIHVFHYLIFPLYMVPLFAIHIRTECQENRFKSHNNEHFYININFNSYI